MSGSVRLSISRLEHGELVVDCVAQKDCSVEVHPQPGSDNQVRVRLVFAGSEARDGERDVHHAVDDTDGGYLVHESHGHLVGVRRDYLFGQAFPSGQNNPSIDDFNARMMSGVYSSVQQQPAHEGINYEQALQNYSSQAFPDITEGREP